MDTKIHDQIEVQIRSPQTRAEWDAYYLLRWRQLRAPWGQPQGSERDDDEQHASHLIALVEKQVVACGRLQTVDSGSGQIRYMAVEPSYQKRGLGTAILLALENKALEMGMTEVYLNARDSCLAFYSKAGYTCIAPGPTLFSSIKHTRMKKKLV